MSKPLSVGVEEQFKAYDKYVNDPRGRLATGFAPLDELLHRGGLTAGTLCLYGGRTRTRKTAVTLNLVNNFLAAGVPCGVVGLDESRHSYIGKLMSVITGLSSERIEQEWAGELGKVVRDEYTELAKNLVMFDGSRPTPKDLTAWLIDSEVTHKVRPKVVFIDYTSLLWRDKFAGAENQRIPRLIEELKLWTNENELITIALHQVGRADEGVGLRYHGDTPMSLEGLKYGGEEIADIVLANYRPALDPLAYMSHDIARLFLGEKYSEEKVEGARTRAKKYQDITFMQLLKNRPGTKTNERGIALRSIDDSQRVVPDTGLSLDPDDVMAFGG